MNNNTIQSGYELRKDDVVGYIAMLPIYPTPVHGERQLKGLRPSRAEMKKVFEKSKTKK